MNGDIESPIYVIMVFKNFSKNAQHLLEIQDSYIVGYKHTLEEARQTVIENFEDLREDCYNYAVIEEVFPELYPFSKCRFFFRYKEALDKYIPIEEPEQFKNICSLTIGG